MLTCTLTHHELQKIGDYLYTFATDKVDSSYKTATWWFFDSVFRADSPDHSMSKKQIKVIVKKTLNLLDQMNRESYNQCRSEAGEHIAFIQREYNLRHISINFEKILWLLDFLLCQCSAGNVPETELYKQLEIYSCKLFKAFTNSGG